MFFASMRPFFRRDATTRPRVYTNELEGAYDISMTAPGVKTEDLSVSVGGDGLVKVAATLRADTTKAMKIPEDGMLGPRTVKALQSFLKQQDMEIGPLDGCFGPRTVAAAQEFMLLRDYDVGEVDGHFGRRSVRAMQEWLRDLDICEQRILGPVDGILGPRTALALQMTLNALKVPAEHDVQFSREIELPRDADLESTNICVTHENGLLRVVVPKRARVPVRALHINGAAADAKETSAEVNDADAQTEEKEEKHPGDWQIVAPEDDDPVAKLRSEFEAKLAEEQDKTAAFMKLAEGGDPMASFLCELHGTDRAAVVRDAQLLNEWEPLLADLHEMGFTDGFENQKAMLKHGGNLKAAVRALVALRASE